MSCPDAKSSLNAAGAGCHVVSDVQTEGTVTDPPRFAATRKPSGTPDTYAPTLAYRSAASNSSKPAPSAAPASRWSVRPNWR